MKVCAKVVSTSKNKHLDSYWADSSYKQPLRMHHNGRGRFLGHSKKKEESVIHHILMYVSP